MATSGLLKISPKLLVPLMLRSRRDSAHNYRPNIPSAQAYSSSCREVRVVACQYPCLISSHRAIRLVQHWIRIRLRCTRSIFLEPSVKRGLQNRLHHRHRCSAVIRCSKSMKILRAAPLPQSYKMSLEMDSLGPIVPGKPKAVRCTTGSIHDLCR